SISIEEGRCGAGPSRFSSTIGGSDGSREGAERTPREEHMEAQALWKDGLEDVIAGRSAICQVDGAAGRLYYRGYEIGELATQATFGEVIHLLWFGELPSPTELEAFTRTLRAARPLPEQVLALLRDLPRDCHPLDALRTAVSLAAATDRDTRASDADANVRKAFRLVSLVPATVAAWQRI